MCFLHKRRWTQRGQPGVVLIKEHQDLRDDEGAICILVRRHLFHHIHTIDTKAGCCREDRKSSRTGSGVNSPTTPPACMSPSHRNKMCGQWAQTHSLYPPDDYTSFKSNNLDSFCFSWCHSSLYFIHLHFL